MATVMPRDVALTDIYTGLRRIGYTHLGALRAMRAAGVPLAEALAASRDAIEVGLGA